MAIAGYCDRLGQESTSVHTLTYTHTNLHVLTSSVREHEYRKRTSMYILYRMYVLYMLYSTQHVHPYMIHGSERDT